MLIDLHTHSNRSDGTDDPAVLMEHAAQAGLDVVALTDHDATEGWAEAQEAADRLGIRLVKGIEISTTYQRASVHLLGYEFDPDDAALTAELDRVLAGREERLPRMLALLAEQGWPLTMEDVAAQSGNAAASGRPHIADAMVAKGYVAHRDEAFAGWLDSGGKAYVRRYSAPLETAIGLVKAAGGRAVIAHPWSRDSRAVLSADAFATLQAAGLDGIEVHHNDHSEADQAALQQIATELDLVVTGSSDHHGTGKIGFDLGCHTTAPDQLERLLG